MPAIICGRSASGRVDFGGCVIFSDQEQFRRPDKRMLQAGRRHVCMSRSVILAEMLTRPLLSRGAGCTNGGLFFVVEVRSMQDRDSMVRRVPKQV